MYKWTIFKIQYDRNTHQNVSSSTLSKEIARYYQKWRRLEKKNIFWKNKNMKYIPKNW